MNKSKIIILSLLSILLIVCSVFGDETEIQKRLTERQIAIHFHENVTDEQISELISDFPLRESQTVESIRGDIKIFDITSHGFRLRIIGDHFRNLLRQYEIVKDVILGGFIDTRTEEQIRRESGGRIYGQLMIFFNDDTTEEKFDEFVEKSAHYGFREVIPNRGRSNFEFSITSNIPLSIMPWLFTFNEGIINDDQILELIRKESIISSAGNNRRGRVGPYWYGDEYRILQRTTRY